MREVAGENVAVPLSVARLVTTLVARSVIERAVVLETLNVKVTDCPALIVVAEAEKVLMTASGVTVTATSRVTEPAPLVTVRR